MKEITKIRNEIYFDEESVQKFTVWRRQEGLSLGQIADALDISPAYLTCILKGQRNVTNKLRKKFRDIGYEM